MIFLIKPEHLLPLGSAAYNIPQGNMVLSAISATSAISSGKFKTTAHRCYAVSM